jgi:hypothetical protein
MDIEFELCNKYAYSILGGNLLKRPSRKPSRSLEDNIKLNYKETENENESCI